MDGTRRLSLDWWSVIAALGIAVLLKAGLFPHIGW
jgi:hypothetical protein